MKNETANQKTTLICAMLTSFMTTFMGSSVMLAVPAIGKQFKAGALELGWIVTIYILASAALSIPFGRLADRIGRKPVFMSGVVGFSISAILCAFAGSMVQLLGGRLLMGMASSMIFSTITALLVSIFPPEKRGRVLGYSTSATYLGLSTGPVLGGWMTQMLGWRSIFWGAFGASLLVIVLGVLFIKDHHKTGSDAVVDWFGNIYYVVITAGGLYGLSALTTAPEAKYIFGVSVLLIPLFFWHELKQEHPVLPIRLFMENRGFALSNLAAFINYSATFAVGYLMSMYLQLVQHISSGMAGVIMLSQPLTMALLSPIAGRLSDKKEPRIIASIGMGLSSLGLFGILFVSTHFSAVGMMGVQLILGLGFAFFSTPNTNAVMGTVPRDLYSVTSSVLATMRLVGQAVSMAIVSLILSTHTAGKTLEAIRPEDLVTGFSQSMWLFGILCALGILASLARGRIHQKKVA